MIFYPLLVVTVAGWTLIPYLKPFVKEIIAFGLLSIIVFCLYHLISSSKFQKWLLVLSTLFLLIIAFIKLTFYYHYGVKLSASALFVIFETNAEETSEFLSYYIDSFVIILSVILFVPWIVLLVYTFSKKRNFNQDKLLRLRKFKILLLLGIVLSTYVIHKKFSDQNIIYTSIASYSDYQDTKAILKQTLAKKESRIIQVTSSLETPQTYIVIIGESTSRWHMQIYGYERETNPLLSEIRDELTVFNNVITPNVHTILALDKMLTLSDFNHPNKKENASLVQLANQAGFTTFWLSNQRPVGIHESVSTLIGNAADHTYFMATDNFTNNIYDENLLPKLKDILKQKDSKKMIFIHLIGTHSDYKKRYPEQFDYFNDVPPKTKFSNLSNEKIVNEYDNAVRYNDYIVRKIIDAARRENKMSYVIYFSDHGDEVYDTMDLMGHNEYYGTKPMYEIPFIAWLSPEYKNYLPRFCNLRSFEDRKYNMEDFIFSFSDLSGIDFNLTDSTRSIFNQDFQERTRWIKKHEDYDNR